MPEYQTFSTDDSSYSENSEEELTSDEESGTTAECSTCPTQVLPPEPAFQRMTHVAVTSYPTPVQYEEQCYPKHGQPFPMDDGSQYQTGDGFGFNQSQHFSTHPHLQLMPQLPHDSSLISVTSSVPNGGHEDHEYTDLSLSVPQQGCGTGFVGVGTSEVGTGSQQGAAFEQQAQSGCSADSFGEILKESLVDAAV